MYHGGSLPYYSDAIPSIRSSGGLKASDDIMVHLLKMRHLAPTHGATMYVPDVVEDALTIHDLELQNKSLQKLYNLLETLEKTVKKYLLFSLGQ